MIPEDTQVYIPPYVLQRDPRYFPTRPDTFEPERWLDESAYAGQFATAFIPFSFGPSNCVGRHLARKEMVTVMTLLLHKFDIEFSDGFDGQRWTESLHDYFVTARDPLLVKLQLRGS